MPRDERQIASPRQLPARVTPPRIVPDGFAFWRAARENLLSIIPEAAYREPIVAGPSRRDGFAWLMISDPDVLEHVLKKRAANYPRSEVTLRILKPRRGDSLFTAPEETWRWQHRAMSPIFQRRVLQGLVPVMSDAAEATATRFAATAPGIRDVYPDMVKATADVICDTALSGRESLDRDALAAGVSRFIERVARLSLLDVFGVPRWVPRPGRILDGSARRMDAEMDAIIGARSARGPSDPPDLLDLLIAARDPGDGSGDGGGRRMSPIELRNNLLAFIVAGHETTALALTWALYLLAFDSDVQERASEEARKVLGDCSAGYADLERLPYIRQVIDETMRLYPPAGLLTKSAIDADSLCGRPLRPGGLVMIPIWALHRHQRLWHEPDAFDPDRFSRDGRAGRHRFAYLPFSAGPRICLGMQFALIEAQVILATLIARFRFALPDGFEPEPKMIFTLRPGNGMPLSIARR
ncbi:MAG: cytochrome P450 [Pseudomonadota bacterium]